MKLPFTIYDLRFTIWKKSSKAVVAGCRACAAGNRKSAIANRQSRSGIALVITLILLSVTLVMAVAFLAISNRERSSVTTTTDATTARLAAETALAQAESQIVSTMLATTNPYNYGLIVSTNYINQNGFDPADPIAGSDPLNVNYDDTVGGIALTAGQLQQNIANLFISPRVPVYIVTNQSATADFRFYLDLNRNGRFDTNGVVTNVDNASPPNGLGTVSTQIGDPEWVGVLERPDTTHGPNNKFLSRYAFIALPVGNSLDVNYIYNQARTMSLSFGNDGFFRNEGVGSWEINLAAFLTDLNTNQWDPPTFWNATVDPYTYRQPNFNNIGRGFEDALSILNYRYGGNYNTLAVPTANAFSALVNAGIDSYTYGNLMTNTQLPLVNFPAAPAYWVGSDNANHLFTPEDFFTRISPPFAFSLFGAGNSASTYDRYTFYRMLSQLGTDSTPESGLMNVNYDNLDPGFNGALAVNGTTSVTNFVPWTPIGFFTNAADRMLRLYTTNWFLSGPSNYLATYYGLNYTNPITVDQFGEVNGLTNAPFFGMTNQIPAFGIANIPVLANGNFVYSPAVNRLLQLAANIYDATTNSFYPSVFRPMFFNDINGNVFINGYVPIGLVSPPGTSPPPPLDTPVEVTGPLLKFNAAATDAHGNVYGVPWIIGAKKGFPNFNEFSMENVMQVTRKLQVTRPATNSPPNATNQMYVFSITNSLGVECWNSYTNAYPITGAFTVTVQDSLYMQLETASGTVLQSSSYLLPTPITATVSVWPGRRFIIPLTNSVPFLLDSAYTFSPPGLIPTASDPTFDLVKPPSPFTSLPQILLTTTNRLQVFMLDNNHVIDYVQLAGPDSSRNVNSEFENANTSFGGPNAIYYTNGVWSTALDTNNVPIGIATQIGISDGDSTIGLNTTYWTDPSVKSEIDGFAHFMGLTPPYGTSSNFMYSTNLAVQVPYTPTIKLYQYTSWQANDPLVHYLQSDLSYSGDDTATRHELTTGVHQVPLTTTTFPVLPDIGQVNARYQPWGMNTQFKSAAVYDTNNYNLAFKDSLVTNSDAWDFPTNKFPGIGWIGRVHRGTPWQTIYLKASNILRENSGFGNIGTNTWALWTGDTQLTSGQYFDAANTAPVSDRLLFDLFTAAPNDNAARGQLSVNQTNLAAWSALFSGMVVLTNTTRYSEYTPLTNTALIIQPAGVSGLNSVLGNLVTNINNMRTNFTNPDGLKGAFEHKGDILSTLQLTEQSPFLNTNNAFPQYQLEYGISDEMYEWLPQQAMSLLRAPSAPRYVIYCYGQALKPAPNGLVTSSGPFFQMITNYQVVTESAARAVIRVEGANTKSPHIVVESFNLLPPD